MENRLPRHKKFVAVWIVSV